ncbi:MAG: hypothetical protein ABSH56_18900 [Bryobacteraceae bacterium]
MSRKLMALNLVLLAAVAWAGWQLHNEWLAAKARQDALRKAHAAAPAPPPLAPLAAPGALLPTTYTKVATEDLFDPSRNPDVPVEPPPAPPPPPPMPPLPLCHGVMDVGEGPLAVLSVNKSSPHQALSPGDTIGQFKLLSVNTQEITLEWNGQVIHKSVEELLDRGEPAPVAAGAANAAAAPPPPPPAMSDKGPGTDTQFGIKTCQPNDSTPEGTVVDGYRKTSKATPFGSACYWEKVDR